MYQHNRELSTRDIWYEWMESAGLVFHGVVSRITSDNRRAINWLQAISYDEWYRAIFRQAHRCWGGCWAFGTHNISSSTPLPYVLILGIPWPLPRKKMLQQFIPCPLGFVRDKPRNPATSARQTRPWINTHCCPTTRKFYTSHGAVHVSSSTLFFVCICYQKYTVSSMLE